MSGTSLIAAYIINKQAFLDLERKKLNTNGFFRQNNRLIPSV